jgi:hypothetical protein
MPPYTAKNRKVCDKEAMVRAAKAVTDKGIGLLKKSEVLDVATATLKEYGNRRGQEAEDLVTMRNGRKPVLSVHTESEFCELLFGYEKNVFRTNDKRHQNNSFFS